MPYCAPAWLYVDTAPASLSATMTMSPGPATIRNVSRSRARLDFTTRPWTGMTSVSTPDAGIVTNLFVIEASPFLPAGKDTTSVTAGGSMSRPCAGIGRLGDVEGEELRVPGTGALAFSPRLSPPLKLAEEAAAKAMAEGLSNYRRNFHAVSSGAPLRVRRLIVVRFHIPFWRRVEAREGNKKPSPPERQKWPTIAERLLTDSPTGPSFSTARRERSEDLSHVRETLNPGVPGHPPHSIFGCLRAVACLPRGRLAYRGSMQIGWSWLSFKPRPSTSYHTARLFAVSTAKQPSLLWVRDAEVRDSWKHRPIKRILA